jgi:hypothetical protein
MSFLELKDVAIQSLTDMIAVAIPSCTGRIEPVPVVRIVAPLRQAILVADLSRGRHDNSGRPAPNVAVHRPGPRRRV